MDNEETIMGGLQLEHSDDIKNIASGLFTFQSEMKPLVKDATGYGYKYATLATVLDEVREPLKKAGLVVTQFHVGDYSLVTMLIHVKSGEYFKAVSRIIPTKKDAQGVGGIITYQRRYQLVSILGLQIEDDDASYASDKNEVVKVESAKPIIVENDKVYKAAVQKLQSGETTIKKIEEKFNIPDDVKTKLQQFVNDE